MRKYIVTGQNEMQEIRQLVSSIEFALIPDGDPLGFKPPIMELQNTLFHIRQKTKLLEAKIIADFGPK